MMEDDDMDFDDLGSEDWDEDTSENPSENPSKIKGVKHLNEIQSLFGLKDFKSDLERKREKRRRRKARLKERKNDKNPTTKIIQTLATKSNPSLGSNPPQIHVFQDPQKRNLNKDSQKEEDESNNPKKSKKDLVEDSLSRMKMARFDVFKFGLSGLDKNTRESEEVAHAVRLGAKPAKKPGMNYKDYKEKLKREKTEAAELKEKQRITGMLKLNQPKNSKKKANNNSDNKKSHEKIQTKMGKFDGGMLKLSAKDIAKIKGKK